ISKLMGQHSEKLTLIKDQPYSLKPGKFILGRTLERVELSITKGPPYLAARIEGKSSNARCG
ncbi:unnamed protein product, partial [marine sediment metagenome]